MGTELDSTDGTDEGTDMGSPYGSVDSCSEGKPVYPLLGS